MLGKLLRGGEVINLSADLGGGKTTFVKGLARGIGSKDRVASPTFTLSKIYHGTHLEIHHYDFYRLADAGILIDQIEESIATPHVVTVVEWSAVVENVLPSHCISLEFKPTATNQDERQICLRYLESRADLVKSFETNLAEIHP